MTTPYVYIGNTASVIYSEWACRRKINSVLLNSTISYSFHEGAPASYVIFINYIWTPTQSAYHGRIVTCAIPPCAQTCRWDWSPRMTSEPRVQQWVSTAERMMRGSVKYSWGAAPRKNVKLHKTIIMSDHEGRSESTLNDVAIIPSY